MNSNYLQRSILRSIACLTLVAMLQACDQEPSASPATGQPGSEKTEAAGKEAPKPFVYLPSSQEQAAAYAHARYNPFGDSIRGIPVGQINGNWCKANEFAREMFPSELLNVDGEDVMEGGAFSITGKIDGAIPFTAMVGVYETCKKEPGFFLLVLKPNPDGKQQVVLLEQFDYPEGFAYLRQTGTDEFELWWCHRCGDYQELQWNKAKQQFVWNETEWR